MALQQQFHLSAPQQTAFIDGTTSVRIGFRWNFERQNVPAELDASLAVFDEHGNLLDAVSHHKVTSKDGTIAHSGNKGGKGDDVFILVNIPQLHEGVIALGISVTCSDQTTLRELNSATCVLSEPKMNQILGEIKVPGVGTAPGVLVAIFYRIKDTPNWTIKFLGQPARANSFLQAVPILQTTLKNAGITKEAPMSVVMPDQQQQQPEVEADKSTFKTKAWNMSGRLWKTSQQKWRDGMERMKQVGDAAKTQMGAYVQQRSGVESEESKKPLTFGIPLTAALENERGQIIYEIPPVVEDCVAYIQNKALDEEGIFRMSGSHNTINKYKEMYDRGEFVNLDEVLDPHVVAGLFKLYLRELPNSLFSKEIMALSMEEEDYTTKLRELLFTSIPISYRKVIQTVFGLVRKVADHSTTNRMTIDNLVIIFSPACQISNELCRTLISDYNKIFASVLGISNEREDKKKSGTKSAPSTPPPKPTRKPIPKVPSSPAKQTRFATPPKRPPRAPFRSKSNPDLLTSSPAPKRPTKSPPPPRPPAKGPRTHPKRPGSPYGMPRTLPKSPKGKYTKFGGKHGKRAKHGPTPPKKPMRPVPPPKPSRAKLSNSNPFAQRLAAFEVNSGSKSVGARPSNRPNLAKTNPFENY